MWYADEYIGQETNTFLIKDSIFPLITKPEKDSLKILLRTKTHIYKTSGRLKKGFGDAHRLNNQEKSLAVLASHHSVKNYIIPFRIKEICFNELRDSAIVVTEIIYGGTTIMYLKDKNRWVKSKILFDVRE